MKAFLIKAVAASVIVFAAIGCDLPKPKEAKAEPLDVQLRSAYKGYAIEAQKEVAQKTASALVGKTLQSVQTEINSPARVAAFGRTILSVEAADDQLRTLDSIHTPKVDGFEAGTYFIVGKDSQHIVMVNCQGQIAGHLD